MTDGQLVCPELYGVLLQTLLGLLGCLGLAVVTLCQTDIVGDEWLQGKISHLLHNSVLRFFNCFQGRLQAPLSFHSSWLWQESLRLGLDDGK